MSEVKTQEDIEMKPMLSEEFAQALMHDLTETAKKGVDVDGDLIKIEVILKVQDGGKKLSIVMQDISDMVDIPEEKEREN
jgi:hypothetical protein